MKIQQKILEELKKRKHPKNTERTLNPPDSTNIGVTFWSFRANRMGVENFRFDVKRE